jgi:hypothetical protein
MKIGSRKFVSVVWTFFVSICALSTCARADTFNFSIYLPDGDSGYRGTVYGTIDLPFLTSPTGSGTGAAASLIFTSLPAGFGTLAGGNVVTNWADQVANTFTVVGGVITSYQFFAVTSPTSEVGDYLCLNSATSGLGTGIFGCSATINELAENTFNIAYDYPNDAITLTSDITTATVPEPGTLVLLGTGLSGLVGAMRRRR